MKIVFLTYLNRSGSTFLLNQLSKSPQVCICPEAEILFDLFLTQPFKKNVKTNKNSERIVNTLIEDKKFALWGLSEKNIKTIIDKSQNNFDVFIELLKTYAFKNNPSSEVIIYKHVWAIKLILKIPDFYKNKIGLMWIILIRDIRAIYLSQKNTISPFSQKPMCSNLHELVKDWKYFINLSIKNLNNEFVKIVKYESLISSTNDVIASLTRFLNINYEIIWITKKKGLVSKMLTQEYKHIHPNIDLAPNMKNINSWNLIISTRYQKILSLSCFDHLKFFEYPVLNKSNKIHILFYPEVIYEIVFYRLTKLKNRFSLNFVFFKRFNILFPIKYIFNR